MERYYALSSVYRPGFFAMGLVAGVPVLQWIVVHRALATSYCAKQQNNPLPPVATK
jgi:hypothetical protein